MTNDDVRPDPPAVDTPATIASFLTPSLGATPAELIASRLQPLPRGCLEWTGAMTGAGQPTMRLHGQRVALRRLLWTTLHPGDTPTSVFRTCTNPRCVAPAHLSEHRPTTATLLPEDLLGTLEPGSDACLLWPGPRSGEGGYGLISIAGRRQLVHRRIWQHLHGPLPDGYIVAHTCDQPACLNPAHLMCCSPAQRVQRTVEQHRFPRGEDHWNHKITQDQADAIKAATTPTKDLTARYPLSRGAINNIRAGRSWTTD